MQRLQHAHDATQGRAYFVAHRGQQHHVGLRSRGGFIAGHNQFASGSAFCGYISNDAKQCNRFFCRVEFGMAFNLYNAAIALGPLQRRAKLEILPGGDGVFEHGGHALTILRHIGVEGFIQSCATVFIEAVDQIDAFGPLRFLRRQIQSPMA